MLLVVMLGNLVGVQLALKDGQVGPGILQRFGKLLLHLARLGIASILVVVRLSLAAANDACSKIEHCSQTSHSKLGVLTELLQHRVSLLNTGLHFIDSVWLLSVRVFISVSKLFHDSKAFGDLAAHIGVVGARAVQAVSLTPGSVNNIISSVLNSRLTGCHNQPKPEEEDEEDEESGDSDDGEVLPEGEQLLGKEPAPVAKAYQEPLNPMNVAPLNQVNAL